MGFLTDSDPAARGISLLFLCLICSEGAGVFVTVVFVPRLCDLERAGSLVTV